MKEARFVIIVEEVLWGRSDHVHPKNSIDSYLVPMVPMVLLWFKGSCLLAATLFEPELHIKVF